MARAPRHFLLGKGHPMRKFTKVLWRNIMSIKPETPGKIPSLFNNKKCTGFFYIRNAEDKWRYVPSKGHVRGSNPHSADQKHQSLSLVLFLICEFSIWFVIISISFDNTNYSFDVWGGYLSTGYTNLLCTNNNMFMIAHIHL